MRLKRVPNEYKSALRSIRRKANRLGIEIKFSVEPVEYCGTVTYGGYFNQPEKRLVVVTEGKPIHKWIGLLLHESCHMDQSADKKLRGKNRVWAWAYRYFADHLISHREGENKMLRKALNLIIECERDTDERVLAKITKWNLPIDKGNYIQNANSYYLSYQLMLEKRKWLNIAHYSTLTILMNNTMLNAYTVMPETYRKRAEMIIQRQESKQMAA